MTSQRDRLAAVLRPAVAAAGYDLEEVAVTPAGRRRLVRVVVDGDGGVPLDGVAEVSRAVVAVLDADEALLGSSPYVLEVTSPGVDRPLSEPRHWRRAVGRLVQAQVAGRTVTGRLVSADDVGVLLDVDGAGLAAGYPGLGRGRVQVEFQRDRAVGVDDAVGDSGAHDAQDLDRDDDGGEGPR